MIDDRLDRTGAPPAPTSASAPSSAPAPEVHGRVSFRTRLVLALLVTSILPLAVFGLIVLVAELLLGRQGAEATMGQVLLFAMAVILVVAIFAAFGLSNELTAPLRAVIASVDRVAKGELQSPIRLAGDDELARLAESHNRLADDLERRNVELTRILAAIDEVSPRDDVDAIVGRIGPDAVTAFALIDATVVMHPATIAEEEDRKSVV